MALLLEKIVTLSHRIAVNDNTPETLDTFVEALNVYENFHGVPHKLDAELPDLELEHQ